MKSLALVSYITAIALILSPYLLQVTNGFITSSSQQQHHSSSSCSSSLLSKNKRITTITSFSIHPSVERIRYCRRLGRPSSSSSSSHGLLLRAKLSTFDDNNNNNNGQKWAPNDNNVVRKDNSSSRSHTTKLFMSESTMSLEKKKSLLQRIKGAIPKRSERKKIFPLALMFFFILFNYTILRDTKDVLMVTAPKSGAEVIPFIKTYVNLPSAIGFTILYSKLCDNLSQKNVFYTCTIPFLLFFSTFAISIYPNIATLHPHAFVDGLAKMLPVGFSAPLSIVRNWSFAVFYVMAEMWGSVVASLLFWSFANEVTTVEEAKKYYPLFGLGANVALIFSGQYVKWVSKLRANLPPGVDAWGISLKYLMGAVVVSGLALLSTFSHMQRKVLTDPECVDQEAREKRMEMRKSKRGKKKVRMGMRESMKFLMNQRYIRDLATLVISYGMCINIVEVSWKSKLKLAFPNPNEYSAFMGNFSSATGTVTLLMMLLGRSIFQKFGWRTAALITPVTIGITGVAFFSLTIFAPLFAPLAASLGTTPLMLAVLVGAAQNILSKSAKYSLFDPCKEMAYIPLDQESKTKGKAAVDVIGNPLGKSGGSFIQQVLIFGVGSLAVATPYLAGILGALIFFWFKAANSLATQFEDALSVENDDDDDESSEG